MTDAKITFKKLERCHFSLLLKWLNTDHVKQFWDKIVWTLELIIEKYSTYIEGYKNIQIDGQFVSQPIHAYVIFCDDISIGYIQYYAVDDFASEMSGDVYNITKGSLTFDWYIGEPQYCGKGLGTRILQLFLEEYLVGRTNSVVVESEITNYAALQVYKKCGFRIMAHTQDGKNVIMSKQNITVEIVKNLIATQFPHWADLPITPVAVSGWDNRTFRLGDDMLVRLPSAQQYAAKVAIEQKWLPLLAPQLTVPIPEPLALGQPTQSYPWQWSVYRWRDGESLNTVIAFTDQQKCVLAQQLAQFLRELHAVDAHGGPPPGPHNFYRGADVAVYEQETLAAIEQVKDYIDAKAALAVWQRATESAWSQQPVWFHGDMSTGNILVKDGQLAAVIDFGGMGVGDLACDLVIAWTFFTGESRAIFTNNIALDSATWARARGWVLWKALITLAALPDKNSTQACEQLRIIGAVCQELVLENSE